MSQERLFEAQVVSRLQLSPSIVRLVLSGAGLSDFATTNIPDEWIYLIFDRSGDDHGRKKRDRKSRPYTVRQWEPETCRLTLDVVCHDAGPATTWAQTTAIGDAISFTAPFGKYGPADNVDWILLMSDLTGLPAVARIIEQHRCQIPVLANVEIAEDGDRRLVAQTCGDCVAWHKTFDRHAGRSCLVDIMQNMSRPHGCGYVWIAGEATAVAQCRRLCQDNWGIEKNQVTAVGYWIAGQARG
ncbi:siderophore-interacting protein [Aliirhizobium smilacinae]|uniref:FAD-binding FR-type domain-containing protein n=1 Tax=Aliirhizobium smilacinae TaxID=1395944 RepID=A0A5C4X9Y9_9HYPH|nr:SIP domain-containing protein [Rhizobium smilacinae]TNM59520.1 hypothetical protein FHP24_28320 [Rhizobium smilacinae]